MDIPKIDLKKLAALDQQAVELKKSVEDGKKQSEKTRLELEARQKAINSVE